MSKHKNFLGKPIELFWTMHKLNNPLSISAYPFGAKQSKKIFNYPQHLTVTYYDNGDLYFDKQETNQLANYIEKEIENDSNYPDIIFNKMEVIGKLIEEQNIDEKKIIKFDLTQLIKEIQKERLLWLDMIAFMSYRGSVEMAEVLKNKVEIIISNEKNKEEIMEAFLTPIKPSIIWEEKESLIQIALSQKTLEDHIKEYNWINYHWFVGTDTNKENLKKRLGEIDKPKEELKKMMEEKDSIETNIINLYKKNKLDKKDQKIISQLRKWIFARSYIKDHINLAAYKLLPILKCIAKKIEINANDILYLTLQEIDSLDNLTRKNIFKKIEERKRSFHAGIFENKFVIEKIDIKKDKINQTDTIKGNIAMKGKIVGHARVILSPKENNEVERGDILVTSMTTPDFLPAMEKAAAFITDEGGITCHAAIIAREMKKPCIIGTKNATKILKSGDIVEINADEGIVNIVKKFLKY